MTRSPRTLTAPRLRAATAVLLGALPLAASGAEAPDEEVLFEPIPSVFSASKYEQKATDAPSVVTVITAEEIALYGYRTLAEALESVPGFYTVYDRNYSYLGVRGFGSQGGYNTRVLLLVDGRRLNDPVYDGALLGSEFPLDVELIERIEVIRGPGSSLYGGNALFGVIHILTKGGRQEPGRQVAVARAGFDAESVRVSWGSAIARSTFRRAPSAPSSATSGRARRTSSSSWISATTGRSPAAGSSPSTPTWTATATRGGTPSITAQRWGWW